MKFIATGVLLIVELNAKQLVNVLIRLLLQCLKKVYVQGLTYMKKMRAY